MLPTKLNIFLGGCIVNLEGSNISHDPSSVFSLAFGKVVFEEFLEGYFPKQQTAINICE